jgi:hypothetical protein
MWRWSTPRAIHGHISAFGHPPTACSSPAIICYREITPPINFHHGIDDDPLGQYLDGLARIEALDPALVLPRHGRPFAGGGRRASAIRQSKLRRVQAVQEVLSGEPLTVKQITAQVYVKAVRTFQLRMAMTEVLGIVGYLRKRDLVERVSDPGGITRFASTVRR